MLTPSVALPLTELAPGGGLAVDHVEVEVAPREAHPLGPGDRLSLGLADLGPLVFDVEQGGAVVASGAGP